jgi:hypothetical protein
VDIGRRERASDKRNANRNTSQVASEEMDKLEALPCGTGSDQIVRHRSFMKVSELFWDASDWTGSHPS